MSASAPSLSLAFGLAFEDLHHRPGLERLDAAFQRWIDEADAALGVRFLAARANPSGLSTKDEADLLIAAAPHLDRFVAR
ncbi:MAG: hypothetical protein ACXWHC_19515, partial [Usitatibacter sp.]